MASRSHWDHEQLERDRQRRYGIEHDPYEEFLEEFELADRYADQASLAPGSAAALALARRRLGRAGPTSSHTTRRCGRRWSPASRSSVRPATADASAAGWSAT